MTKKLYTSIPKQEEVVSALWDFAHNLETRYHDAKSLNPDGTTKTTVNLKVVHTTLEKIMTTFGYKTVEIQ